MFGIKKMNSKQQKAFNLVKSGKTIFMTGAGGVGKTYVLKEIVKWANENNKNIALTSSTGTSALTLGNGMAKTLHSYLHIFLAKKPAHEMVLYTEKKSPKTIQKLKTLEILAIDELSMISSELFDKVSEYLSIIRKNKAPFGGIQLVLTGDFFQLPPVQGDYCFKAKTWKELNPRMIELTDQIRQDGDKEFQRILTEARWGRITDQDVRLLSKLNPHFGEVRPTVLYSKNIDVDNINNKEYTALLKTGAEERVFYTTLSNHRHTKGWSEALKIPDKISLCVGAQVMLTVNLSVDDGLANGSRGIITGFTEEGPIVLFKNGDQIIIEDWVYKDEDEDIWASAIPLKLAYALTIHKSQSMTLDSLTTDLGPGIFEYGQAYVALSRVRDLKSIKVINILKSSFQANQDVVDFYLANSEITPE
jgi:ATP-dependent exoDNAse (exonuclease V) alpha subunit